MVPMALPKWHGNMLSSPLSHSLSHRVSIVTVHSLRTDEQVLFQHSSEESSLEYLHAVTPTTAILPLTCCAGGQKKGWDEVSSRHPSYHIVCGVMRFLCQNGKPEVDFFKECVYADFRSTLDSKMRRLKQAGICSCKHRAEPLAKE